MSDRFASATAVVFILALAGCTPVTSGDAPPLQLPTTAAGVERTEIIEQVPPPPVDALFVVDNSSSMGDEQQTLAENFPTLVDSIVLSGLDFHIGVVATDVERNAYSGKLVATPDYRYIDTQTPQPQLVFDEMVNGLDVIVGSNESGRDAAYLALETRRDEPTNVGFYREDASLQVIFVSDADDYSFDISKTDFLDWADTLKADDDMVRMHAITGLIADPDCSGGYRPGFDYLDYADHFDSFQDSICTGNWTPIFNNIVLMASQLRTTFRLDGQPLLDESGAVTVTVRNDEIDRDFQVCMSDETGCEVMYDTDSNAVRFLEFVPAVGDDIVLGYRTAE